MTMPCSNSLDNVLGAIYAVVAEVNLQLPQRKRIVALPETALFGEHGALDSLALANFIVIAEQKVNDAFGIQLDLTQDDPFTSGDGHFKTLESLARYVAAQIEKNQGD